MVAFKQNRGWRYGAVTGVALLLVLAGGGLYLYLQLRASLPLLPDGQCEALAGATE